MARFVGLTDQDHKNPEVREALAAQELVDELERKLRAAHEARDAAVLKATTSENAIRGLTLRLADEWKITRRGVDDMKRRARDRAKSEAGQGHTEPDGRTGEAPAAL